MDEKITLRTEPVITQDSLNRLESNARRELDAHKDLDNLRFLEHERRLSELNNSHERATLEKKRTDEEAVRIKEITITKKEFDDWKTVVDRQLNTQAGATAQKAVTITALSGIVVFILNFLINYFIMNTK